MEAYFFAEWLGGKVQSREQWNKMIGAMRGDDEKRTGPYDGPAVPQGMALLSARWWQVPRWRPWPVTTTTRDTSCFGARQVISNGMEWTRTPSDRRYPLPLEENFQIMPSAYVVGQRYSSREVLTFEAIRQNGGSVGLYPCDHVDPEISFRVVLEP
jgi:hypothetical protein